jgi:di/tricarboxylate transporter
MISLTNIGIYYIQAGILKAEDVAPLYFKDIIALFFGSLSFAYAVESVNLHRRIALFVLSRVGTSTKWYVFYELFD